MLLLACTWVLGCSSSDDALATSGSPAGSGGAATASSSGTGGDGGSGGGSCSVVQTAQGPVMGDGSDGGCTFLGIPYAAPPTGELRWKPPQPAAAWTTPRPSAAASACPQAASLLGEASTDEDCLYVNIWVPVATAAQPASKRPVMVFVYGGGFTTGSGTVPLYDGTKLASATGAVVVTLNYRLGPFGFLSNAALRAEDPTHPSAGNYGIEDQIAALQWVKTNAAAFGGDASNVTVFGESAGGTSTLTHLASPKSAGLFARAIVESPWAEPSSTSFTTARADAYGAQLAQALDCTRDVDLLSCLRGKEVSDVLQVVADSGGPFSGGISWAPVVDGFVLPDSPLKVFESGSFNEVPTVIGNNRNEGTLFFYVPDSGLDLTAPTDDASYLALEEMIYPGHGAAIVAEYPVSAFGGSYAAAAAEAMGDAAFVCGSRRIARALAAAGVPTFRYDFTHALDIGVPGVGAFHASELPFVFGNPLQAALPLTAGELPLSAMMMRYWGSMAKNGDPNTDGEVGWPGYDGRQENQIVLDLSPSTESAFKQDKCDFWDGLTD